MADYFVKRNKVPDYRGTKDVIKHVDEFFKLMKVLTNDNTFETVYNENISKGTGGVTMDRFLNSVMEKGVQKGLTSGKAEIIQEMIKKGNMSVEQIASILKLPVEKVRELAEMVLVTV